MRAIQLLSFCLLLGALLGCGEAPDTDEFIDPLEGVRRAERYFQVRLNQRSILGNKPLLTEAEKKTFRETQKVMIASPRVVDSAMRKMKHEVWTSLPYEPKSEEWIGDRLRVDFPAGSEVIRIALDDDKLPKEAMVEFVEQVGQAYLNTVLFEGKIQRQKPRDILAESYRDLEDEIRRKSKAYYALLADTPSPRLPEVALRVELLKQKISRLSDKVLEIDQEKLRTLAVIASEVGAPALEDVSLRIRSRLPLLHTADREPDIFELDLPPYDPSKDPRLELTLTMLGSTTVVKSSLQGESLAGHKSEEENETEPPDDQESAAVEPSGEEDEKQEVYTEVLHEQKEDLARLEEIDAARNKVRVIQHIYDSYAKSVQQEIAELTLQAEGLTKEDPELADRADEIEVLKELQREIARKIEIWDIELRAPDRVVVFGGVDFYEGD